jgi:hypothetical protein
MDGLQLNPFTAQKQNKKEKHSQSKNVPMAGKYVRQDDG